MNQRKKNITSYTQSNGIPTYQKVIIIVFVALVAIKYVPKLFKEKCIVQEGDVWNRSLSGILVVRQGLPDEEITQVSTDSVYKVDEDNVLYYYYGSDGMKDSCDCKDFTFESPVMYSVLKYRKSSNSSE